MSDLVYTCVFDNYDWVLPPIKPSPGVHHVIVTDRDGPSPAGWERHVVDPDAQGGPAAANRYWKILGFKEFTNFTRTLYVDANIRLLGDSATFLDEALPEGVAIRLFRHPIRNTIADEAQECVRRGKVSDATALNAELAHYKELGFPDDVGLSENTIIARRQNAPELDEAMQVWWDLYSCHTGRDQISLPVARWRTALEVHWIDWSFRNPNPWFAIYPHRKGRGINPRYALVQARAHDSSLYAAIQHGWNAFRTIRRGLGLQRTTRSKS